MSTIPAGSTVVYNSAEYVLAADVDAAPVVPPKVYPKLLWDKNSVEAAAVNAEDEATKRADGFTFDHRPTSEDLAATASTSPAEPPAELPAEVPPPDPENEPATFGASDDDTHAKKGSKKK